MGYHHDSFVFIYMQIQAKHKESFNIQAGSNATYINPDSTHLFAYIWLNVIASVLVWHLHIVCICTHDSIFM